MWDLREYKREFTTFLAQWLAGLPKSKGKLFYMLSQLEMHGQQLTGGFVEHLQDGIFEFKFTYGGQICRFLFFYWPGYPRSPNRRAIFFVKCFQKKTRKCPQEYIDQAIERRDAILAERVSVNVVPKD